MATAILNGRARKVGTALIVSEQRVAGSKMPLWAVQVGPYSAGGVTVMPHRVLATDVITAPIGGERLDYVILDQEPQYGVVLGSQDYHGAGEWFIIHSATFDSATRYSDVWARASEMNAEGRLKEFGKPADHAPPSIQIEYRRSVSARVREMTPEMVHSCIRWMERRYPDVDFSGITWEIAGGSIRPKYYPKQQKILICTSGYVGFYARACREIRGLREEVGVYGDLTMPANMIHEMTHHVQYARGYHRGNETDTSLNELCWLREHCEPIFKRCFDGPPAPVEIATIRRRKPGDPRPAWMPPEKKNGGRRRLK